MTTRLIMQCIQCAEYEAIGQKKGICNHPEYRGKSLINSEGEIPQGCPYPEAFP